MSSEGPFQPKPLSEAGGRRQGHGEMAVVTVVWKQRQAARSPGKGLCCFSSAGKTLGPEHGTGLLAPGTSPLPVLLNPSVPMLEVPGVHPQPQLLERLLHAGQQQFRLKDSWEEFATGLSSRLACARYC